MCREIPNIVGWKMTYNYKGHVHVAKALSNFTRHVAVLGAPANLFHATFSLGILDGVLTGSLNFSAELILKHIDAFKKGEFSKAKEIWNSGLGELQDYVYLELGRLHVRYKLSTWLRGLIKSPLMRPPMPQPNEQETMELKELLSKAGYEGINRSM
jgi:dihydrodipicolinate synthase/N-acetylneuraminate lyase